MSGKLPFLCMAKITTHNTCCDKQPIVSKQLLWGVNKLQNTSCTHMRSLLLVLILVLCNNKKAFCNNKDIIYIARNLFWGYISAILVISITISTFLGNYRAVQEKKHKNWIFRNIYCSWWRWIIHFLYWYIKCK